MYIYIYIVPGLCETGRRSGISGASPCDRSAIRVR